jgi:hypothetical protein
VLSRADPTAMVSGRPSSTSTSSGLVRKASAPRSEQLRDQPESGVGTDDDDDDRVLRRPGVGVQTAEDLLTRHVRQVQVQQVSATIRYSALVHLRADPGAITVSRLFLRGCHQR